MFTPRSFKLILDSLKPLKQCEGICLDPPNPQTRGSSCMKTKQTNVIKIAMLNQSLNGVCKPHAGTKTKRTLKTFFTHSFSHLVSFIYIYRIPWLTSFEITLEFYYKNCLFVMFNNNDDSE